MGTECLLVGGDLDGRRAIIPEPTKLIEFAKSPEAIPVWNNAKAAEFAAERLTYTRRRFAFSDATFDFYAPLEMEDSEAFTLLLLGYRGTGGEK